MCKRLREDDQKLEEEKTTLEGMIHFCDELIMEMVKEYGLNRMGENNDNEDDQCSQASHLQLNHAHRLRT
jgi:hypothetical protein